MSIRVNLSDVVMDKVMDTVRECSINPSEAVDRLLLDYINLIEAESELDEEKEGLQSKQGI